MRRLLPLLALLALLPVSLEAQEGQQVIVQPQPIEADAPTAKVALALAQLLLAGDRAKIDTHLKEHGAAAFVGGDGYATAIGAALDALKSGPRTIVGQDGFDSPRGPMVGVQLADAAGDSPTRAIVVRLEGTGAYKVANVRVVAISINGGD